LALAATLLIRFVTLWFALLIGWIVWLFSLHLPGLRPAPVEPLSAEKSN